MLTVIHSCRHGIIALLIGNMHLGNLVSTTVVIGDLHMQAHSLFERIHVHSLSDGEIHGHGGPLPVRDGLVLQGHHAVIRHQAVDTCGHPD